MEEVVNRPTVKIEQKNKIAYLSGHLNGVIPDLTNLKGVVGITLNGGLSRGYADHLSEIDITIFLDNDTFALWNSGNSPITTFITKIDNELYDIKYVCYSNEVDRKYSIETELWDLSYAKILFDPEKKIETFIQNKLSKKSTIAEAEQYMFGAWWYYRLATDIWIHRDDVLQGHMMLNNAVAGIIKALFCCNEEYIPHEKWLVHMSRTVKWKPHNWEQDLENAFSTGKMNLTDLKNRQNNIDKLWSELDLYLKEKMNLSVNLSIIQKSNFNLLNWLYKKKKVSIEEWEAKAGLELLNCDPFSKIVEMKDNYLIINIEACNKITEKDMYYLFYETLNEVVINNINKKKDF